MGVNMLNINFENNTTFYDLNNFAIANYFQLFLVHPKHL